MSAMMIGALALLLLIILIVLHVPVAVAMAVVGLAATCLLTGNIQGGLSLFADSTVESLSYSGFMIIPLFILMGGFAGISGLSRDLFRLSAAWLGWAKGGVGLATIGTCAGFGAICGSSVATTATMVNMALPELQKRHYSDVLSSGVIVGGSTLGSIIPPSMIMVIYAIQAEQSVRDLFVAAKGFPYGIQSAKTVRDHLAGSYLWQRDDNRAVQDPLSFRDGVWILSALSEARQRAADKLAIQLNHGDDNPTVVADARAPDEQPETLRRYIEGGGALFSSANFDPTPWLLDYESTTVALAHNANASVQRLIKLNDPAFTHLSRFLGTENSYHAFGAMEKPPVALAREIQLLANPASVASVAVAGNIEDVATNAPLAISRLETAADDYAYILGMELIHAAQAIDLRLKENPGLALGKNTRALYDAFRKQVTFLDADRPLSDDFARAHDFILAYRP